MPQPYETSIYTPGLSDLPQELNWDCVIFLRRTEIKNRHTILHVRMFYMNFTLYGPD